MLYNYNNSRSLAWYEISGGCEKVMKLSQQLSSRFPPTKFRLFSLGQSPAWIVKGAELLSPPEHKAKFGYIAFSSSFLEPKPWQLDFNFCKIADYTTTSTRRKSSLDKALDKANRPTQELWSKASFKLDTDRVPDQNKVKNYRNYLTSIGMDVNSIISLWKDKRIKTVIIDHTVEAKGYASFMSVLCTWANELGKLNNLKAALQLVNLRNDNLSLSGLIEPITRTYFDMQLMRFNPDNDLEPYGFRDILYMLRDGDKHGDRLTASYPSTMWDQPPQVNDNSMALNIEQKLVNVAQNRMQNVYSKPTNAVFMLNKPSSMPPSSNMLLFTAAAYTSAYALFKMNNPMVPPLPIPQLPLAPPLPMAPQMLSVR